MNHHLMRAVGLLGGEIKAAERLGTTRQAVRNWMVGYRMISHKNALKIEAETDGEVTRENLRPDIYPPRAA